MSNILVTGGLGLIGHNVVDRLQRMGHRVAITDIRTNYGIIPQDEIDYLMTERLKKIQPGSIHAIDISSESIDWLFERYKFDIVIHMASFPRQKVVNANPTMGAKTMMEGLLNLCEVGKKHKIKKFVFSR
jgi:nucleoside-diphosphate-sugar epimerase